MHIDHVSAGFVKGRACDYTLCVPCAQADEQKGDKGEDESLCQGPGAEDLGGLTKTPRGEAVGIHVLLEFKVIPSCGHIPEWSE